MDLRSVISIELVKNNRTYRFSMEFGSPYGEAYDAAFEVLKKIADLSREAVENASPKEMTQQEFQEAIDKAN